MDAGVAEKPMRKTINLEILNNKAELAMERAEELHRRIHIVIETLTGDERSQVVDRDTPSTSGSIDEIFRKVDSTCYVLSECIDAIKGINSLVCLQVPAESPD